MAKEIKYGSEHSDQKEEMSFLTNLSERRLLQTMV